jgi:hypothetical protein
MFLPGRFTAFALFVALIVACMALSSSALRGEEPVAWLTGEKLRAQLEQKTGIDWGGTKGRTFREAIASLSRAQRVAMLIDRRVDPDQKIELSIDDAPLESALKLIAANRQIGMAQVGSVIYLGPKATAEKLRTLAALRKDEALKLPSAARSRILQPHPMRWEELATPRDLLSALSGDAKVRIDGTVRISHDLWSAADLPAANFIDRLTLIAGQFDLTFRFADDGESVQLIDMPPAPVIEKGYPLRGGLAQRAKEIEKKLAESLPGATIEAAPDKLVVRGRAEDQDFVETYLSGRPAHRAVTAGEKKLYTLTIVMPVGQLIKTLGKKLDLDVQIDEEAVKAAGLSLTTEVRVNVKDATADELLKAVLAPAGLAFERQGMTIRVRPAKK